jgi:hypothetical protein
MHIGGIAGNCRATGSQGWPVLTSDDVNNRLDGDLGLK